MEQQLVWLTYENLDDQQLNTLAGAKMFGDLCKSFTLNGVRVDGTPVQVEVDVGMEFDSVTGKPLQNIVRVGVAPLAS
jgi:nicotinic acid phosphoribosyltransferase